MSDTGKPLVRVPEHVKDRLDREASETPYNRGDIVERWMRKADELDERQGDFKDEMQTRGGVDE